MVTCPRVHLSGGHLSVVLGFTCPGVHLSGVQLSGVHLFGGSVVGGSVVRTFRRFGVATPRGSHSQGYAVLLKYIHGLCCSAEIYMGEAVLLEYCGEISPAFPCRPISISVNPFWTNTLLRRFFMYCTINLGHYGDV